MKPRLSRVMDIPLSAAATRRARILNGEFGTALVTHAKTLAYEQHEDTVLVTHIEAAHALLTQKRAAQGWAQLWGGIIGGGLFGACLPGLATELMKGTAPSTVLLVVYIASGILGPLLIFLTHRK